MSVTSKIPNVVFLGLLVSLCLLSDLGFGTAETIVDTDPHVVLEVGTRGILPCRVQTKAYSVEWKRQLSSETETLVFLDTYVYVGARDGPGYEAGLFNITDNYSLVIKDVKVKDEGLYICSVSDFKSGKFFRNSTRVSVQAFPDEPFPVIQECIGKDVNSGACTLTIYSTSNLTCIVRGYYPDIDLFFLHGSEKKTSTAYGEWSNADGTKNKHITIQISISDEPYECVASSLPGIVGNRSVSVIVHEQFIPPTHSQGPNVAAIVVSVLMIVGICLSIAVIINCRVCRYTRHGFYRIVPGAASARAPEGPVSKFELWTLVTKAKEKGNVEKLRNALSRLGHLSKTDTSKLDNRNDFYESLCEWKNKTSSYPNQRKKLYSACFQVGMFDITRTLEDIVLDTSYKVPKADIEHILWKIRDTRKICELLKALELAKEEVIKASEKGIREVINVARTELLMWRLAGFQINPIIILSLKLDELQCDTDFFKINMSMKEEIDEEEMLTVCSDIFEKHYKYLVNSIRHHQGEDLPYDIRKFVKENNASLFNTLEMLRNWVRDEESSNYEKVNKILKAEEALRQAHHEEAKWPPDDDLRGIASFLSPTSMEQLCSKLEIESPPQKASQEERFHALSKWRDSYASSKDLMEKHTELFSALKEVERGDLLPHVKGPLVYKAELVDLAFHLFAQDLLPFTEALGITAAKLVVYRPTFQPSHMTQGTIGLVCKLFESGERCHLLNLLKEMPYPNVFASVMLALEVSFGEVCAVSNDPISRQNLNGMQSTFAKSKSMLRGDHNAFIGIIVNETSSVDKDRSSSPGSNSTHGNPTYNECVQQQPQNKVYNETTDDLETMQTSAVDEEDHDQVCSESLTYLNQFKVWREQPRLTSFNFRQAVANCLGSVGCYEEVSNFLQGHYNEGNIPYTFIDNILHTMDPMQRSDLGNLIRVAPFNPVAARLSIFPIKEEKWSRLEEEVSRNLHAWVNEWILQITQTKWKKGEDGVLKIVQIAQMHKEFNDKLVENGFLELAREIMINERQLMDARGRPITVTDSGFR